MVNSYLMAAADINSFKLIFHLMVIVATILGFIGLRFFTSTSFQLQHRPKQVRQMASQHINDVAETPFQQQDFDKDGIKGRMSIWTSICDQRLSKLGHLGLHTLVYWDVNSKEDPKTLLKNGRCKMFWKHQQTEVPVSSVISGKHNNGIISCFFPANLFTCPDEVSINPGTGAKIKNRMKVEKQSAWVSDGLIFCVPLLVNLNGSGFTNWHQFVEWMEYLRYIGLAKVVMPRPILDSSGYPFATDLLQAIKFYERTGFLKTFPVSYFLQNNPKIKNIRDFQDDERFYEAAEDNKQLIYSYCTLKYGPMHSHVLVGDFDEIPAFDIKKYKHVMGAVNEMTSYLRRKHRKSIKFFELESIELLDCSKTESIIRGICDRGAPSESKEFRFRVEEVLGDDSRILVRQVEAKRLWKGVPEPGKTVYRSTFPLLVHIHYIQISLEDVTSFKMDDSFPVSTFAQQTSKHSKPPMKLSHHRRCEALPSRFVQTHRNWRNASWLKTPVREEILKRIRATAQQIGVLKSRN